MTDSRGYDSLAPTTQRGVLRLPRTVLFGAGQRHVVGLATREYGSSVLVCTDRRFAQSDEMASIHTSLEEAGCTVRVFSDTEPELPMPEVARSASKLAESHFDVVVGVGGGSCLDMAKVIALLATHGGDLDDYIGERRVPGPVVPLVAVPTTAGTGSEATPVAVLADPRTGTKRGISSPHLIPQVAVCDSDLIASCPQSLIAAAGADALTHLVESYTAIGNEATVALPFERVFVGKSAFTDQIALEGVRRLARSLVDFHDGRHDRATRDDVMFGALAGGVALGTAGTAAAHALQYPVGALTKTAHGVGVGALLPYVMRFNLPVREPEFARIGEALGLARSGDQRADAIAAIARLDAILGDLGIPASLADLGVRLADLDVIATQSLDAVRLTSNNPRLFDLEAAREVVRRAYAGDRTIATV